MAVGPIVAVILVGVGVSMLLEFADNKLGITDRVIAALDELGADAEQYLAQRKREALNSVGRTVNHIIDQATESAQAIAINWVSRKLREYLSPSLGVR